jgi:hypothetical protein
VDPFLTGFADELCKLALAPAPRQEMLSPKKLQPAAWRPSPKYSPAPAAKAAPAATSQRGGGRSRGVSKGYTAKTLGFSSGRSFIPAARAPKIRAQSVALKQGKTPMFARGGAIPKPRSARTTMARL